MHVIGFSLLIYSLYILDWKLFAVSTLIIEGGHIYNHVKGIEPYDFRPHVCFWRSFFFILFTLAVFFGARMFEVHEMTPEPTAGEIQMVHHEEVRMAEMMDITVEELRSQTPEEHMAAMQELANARQEEGVDEEEIEKTTCGQNGTPCSCQLAANDANQPTTTKRRGCGCGRAACSVRNS